MLHLIHLGKFLLADADLCMYSKRLQDQGSDGSSQTQFAWIDSSSHVPHSSSSSIHLNISPIRFPGDGLDNRRPIMSLPPQEIIDLTEENSPPEDANLSPGSIFGPTPQRRPRPRLVRDIISIDDQESSGDRQTITTPELELLFSRTLLPTVMPQSRRRIARHIGVGIDEESSTGGVANIEQRDNGFPQVSGATWAEWRNRGHRNHYITLEERAERQRRRQIPQPRPPREQMARPAININGTTDPMFMNSEPDLDLPGHLDFYTQGFHMGPMAPMGNMGNLMRHTAAPTYDPPSSPRPGYTRAPKEDDILACPNCEEELGVGDNEIKKQVWVIKRCGHVSPHSITIVKIQADCGSPGLLRRMHEKPAEIWTSEERSSSTAQTICKMCC